MEKNALSPSNNRGKFSEVSLLNPLIPVYDVLPTKCQMGVARVGCHAVPDTALREREERTPGETRSVTPCHAASRNGTAGARVGTFSAFPPRRPCRTARAVRNTTSAIQVRWRTGRPPAGGASGLKRDAPAAAEYGRSWGAKRTAGRAATCPGATAASRHVTQRSRPDQIRTQNKKRIYSASAAPLRRIPAPRSGRMGAFLFLS